MTVPIKKVYRKMERERERERERESRQTSRKYDCGKKFQSGVTQFLFRPQKFDFFR